LPDVTRRVPSLKSERTTSYDDARSVLEDP
jgi:hypothetical protein